VVYVVGEVCGLGEGGGVGICEGADGKGVVAVAVEAWGSMLVV
jgi:hypothetical protein